MTVQTLSTTASELLPRNKYRLSFVVQNEDASIFVYLKHERGATVSSTDHDHRLGPGAAIALNFSSDGMAVIQDRWTVIAASGTPIVSYFETKSTED